MPPSKRKRGAVQEGAAAAEGGRRFAVNDRVKAEFIEKVSGDEGRFWTEGTVTRVAASGAVTVAFDLDGMVEVYPRKDAATELRHGPPLPRPQSPVCPVPLATSKIGTHHQPRY